MFTRKSRFLQMEPRFANPLKILTSAPDAADFGLHAADWWDVDGPMAPLHRLNPTRLAYLKQVICTHFNRPTNALQPFESLTVLDIGCGGGLVSEPLARLGAQVTGVDASAELIAIARDHATAHGLAIAYEAILSDVLVKRQQTYDVVLALEVIEHVADADAFLRNIKALLKPQGVAILSTLNRTPQSYLKGILAAEYLVRWVPRGTHDWSQFRKPSELVQQAADAGLQATATMGLHYDLWARRFELRSDRVEVNYFMVLNHGA